MKATQRRPWLILASFVLVALVCGACSGVGDDSGDPGTPPPEESTPTPGSEPSTSTTTPVPTASAAQLDGPPQHEGDRAFQQVEQLAGAIGIRVSGTPAEDEAVAYIAGQLEAYGYTVELLEFQFDTPGRFAAISGPGFVANGTALSGSLPEARSGAAVFVGLASVDDLAGLDLEGRVAVADRGTLTFREKYDNVLAAGATGLVIINDQPGLFGGNLNTRAEIPVAGVAGVDGDQLREAAEAGDVLTVEVAALAGVNVLARATPDARCGIIIGGHHDTVPGAPGAHDNGSGTANVIELARAFAVDGLDAGLCFATFGAEESGLFGSTEMATDMLVANELPAYMVNLDVTGIGDSVEVIGDTEMQDLAMDIAGELDISAVRSLDPAGSSSDHASFINVGVPVVFFTSGNFSIIHTPGDTLDKIDPAALDLVGDLAYATIVALLERLGEG